MKLLYQSGLLTTIIIVKPLVTLPQKYEFKFYKSESMQPEKYPWITRNPEINQCGVYFEFKDRLSLLLHISACVDRKKKSTPGALCTLSYREQLTRNTLSMRYRGILERLWVAKIKALFCGKKARLFSFLGSPVNLYFS